MRTRSAISSRSRSTGATWTEGEALVEPYLDLLRAGGSAPPAELASRLGFDIGDPGFWSAGLDAIGVLVDEAERSQPSSTK